MFNLTFKELIIHDKFNTNGLVINLIINNIILMTFTDYYKQVNYYHIMISIFLNLQSIIYYLSRYLLFNTSIQNYLASSYDIYKSEIKSKIKSINNAHLIPIHKLLDI